MGYLAKIHIPCEPKTPKCSILLGEGASLAGLYRPSWSTKCRRIPVPFQGGTQSQTFAFAFEVNKILYGFQRPVVLTILRWSGLIELGRAARTYKGRLQKEHHLILGHGAIKATVKITYRGPTPELLIGILRFGCSNGSVALGPCFRLYRQKKWCVCPPQGLANRPIGAHGCDMPNMFQS